MRLDAAGSLAPTGTSIDTGDCPERVAFAPDGRLALVLHSNSHDPMAGTQTVVALANDAAGAVKIVAELKELSKTNPHDVAFSGDGRKAYVSDFDIEGKGGVHVLDVAPGCGVSYSKKIPLAVPTALQVLPGDAHAIVIGGKDPLDVAVLDLTAGTVAAQYDLFSDFVDAQSIGLSPDAKRLLVPNASPFSSLADQVTVLSLTTAGGVPVPAVQMVMANVPEPSGVAYSPDGTKALVTNFSKNRATWLDVAAGGSISLGGTVTGIPLADRVSTLRRGPNAGLVLVTAVTDIHLLQFGASSVTSKGKVSLGSGNGAIAGDVAVEP
jgi:DNA-binding beta-propeller fold protein YncE